VTTVNVPNEGACLAEALCSCVLRRVDIHVGPTVFHLRELGDRKSAVATALRERLWYGAAPMALGEEEMNRDVGKGAVVGSVYLD
jgi:hypothetical protein